MSAANGDYLEFAIARRSSTRARRSCRISASRSRSRTRAAPCGYDPVTVADHAAEALIRDGDRAGVSRLMASAARSTGASAGTSRYTWVIDPIDGTKSFILGQLHWATLIALHDGERVVVGVAHQPYVGETFVATPAAPRSGAAAASAARLRRARCRASATRSSRRRSPTCSTPRARWPRFSACRARARLTRYGGDCYATACSRWGSIDVVIESLKA